MADIVSGTVSGQLDLTSVMQDHSDIRAEGFAQESNIRRDIQGGMADGRFAGAMSASDIRREIAKEASDVSANVKEAGWKVIDRVENAADRAETGFDRVVGQETAYFIASQQNNFANATALAALRASQDASFAKTQADIALSTAQTSAAATLAGEKNAAAAALGQALITQAIMNDGNNTRALINTLKMDELNRTLSERHNSLVECHHENRYATLLGQMQNLNSQVNSKIANFGSGTVTSTPTSTNNQMG